MPLEQRSITLPEKSVHLFSPKRDTSVVAFEVALILLVLLVVVLVLIEVVVVVAEGAL